MKIYKSKKNVAFSLIVLIFCCVLVYSTNSIFNITGFISTKIEIIKEKEMKFMYGEPDALGDKYSESSQSYYNSNIVYHRTTFNKLNNQLISRYNNAQGQNQYSNINSDKNMFLHVLEEKTIKNQLKKQVEDDSYRNKNFGLYYIFDFERTINVLKELDLVIEKTSEAQKMPKELLTAVLFREMMFIGQEDLLDGVPYIGGKTIGICQIGIDIVRYNEQIVHGKESIVANKTDDEILTMLRNPKQGVYFCALQLRARAIQQTGNNKVDLNKLNEAQMHKILEGYNQSNITKTIGPIKTKAKYAEETYKYYELFSKYYELGQAK